ncbi:hypothetical protein [Paractinoplanes rishiriensis]|uniref:hypothetical protein n=1 Tax=Paractinoplanes rishiriensis TaxID=1050105 RepID=UPI00194473E1|nr:hypothetical protein [Actinoplanes rishiriensis]
MLAIARTDIPAREARRIAANRSTFDINGIAGSRPDPPILPSLEAGPELVNIESTRSRWDPKSRTKRKSTSARRVTVFLAAGAPPGRLLRW